MYVEEKHHLYSISNKACENIEHHGVKKEICIMEETKLYAYNYENPELSDDILEHYGIKGMRWGVRKDRGEKKGLFRKKKGATNKDEALSRRDLKYISSHKNEFSTNELNNLLNRINTEQRIDQLYRSTKKSRVVVNKMKKAAKIIAPVAITAFAVAAIAYKKRVGEHRYITDKQSTGMARDVMKDFAGVFGNELFNRSPLGKVAKGVKQWNPNRLDRMRGNFYRRM